MHNVSSLLNIILHVSDGPSIHHQESRTAHTSSGICHTEIPKMDKITITLNSNSIHFWNFSLTYTWCCMCSLGLLMMIRRDRPKHVEWYTINSRNCASSWFYHRDISRCMVPWKSNNFSHLYRTRRGYSTETWVCRICYARSFRLF